MKSKMHLASLCFGAAFAAAIMSSAYALNPQPLPPGAHGVQRDGEPEAAKMRRAQPEARSTGSGAAQKAGKAGMSTPAGQESAAGAAKSKGYLKMDLPAVQKR